MARKGGDSHDQNKYTQATGPNNVNSPWQVATHGDFCQSNGLSVIP